MEYPVIKIQLTREGVEAIELEYKPGTRDTAWDFAHGLLPAVHVLHRAIRQSLPSLNKGESAGPRPLER